MNRRLKTVLTVAGWGALAAYLFVAARYCADQNDGRVCTGLRIEVLGEAYPGLVTPESVRQILVGERMRLTGARLDSIDLRAVERAIAARAHIRRVKVYASLDGKLNIEAEPRDPVLRLQTANGYRRYLSADGYVWPVRGDFFVDIPIVSGVPTLPFGTEFAGKIPDAPDSEKKSAESGRFLWNLINFVQFLHKDDFWGSQVVQIDVGEANEVVLVPRAGRGIVRLGALDGYPEKLDKLFNFYTRGLAYEGWERYAVIDLRYRGQVVCTE